MGWFDDEDDDKEDDEDTRAGASSSSTLQQEAPNTKRSASVAEKEEDEDEDEDEEDPLDAFMKTLNTSASLSSKTGMAPASESTSRHNHHHNQPRHRMDLENEDTTTDGESANNDEEEDEQYLPKQGLDLNTNVTTLNKRTANSTTTTNANGILFHKALLDGGESFLAHRHARRFWTAHDTPRGRTWRNTHEITCSKSIDPLYEWSELFQTESSDSAASSAISTVMDVEATTINRLVNHLQSTIPQPTPVQQQTIPVLLLGHNACITAATGQGKTLSYVIPALIRGNGKHHRGLTIILVPTRELALQVERAARPLLKIMDIKCKSIIGGKESNYDVVKDLKRQNYGMIVASPGRLIDVTKKVSLDPTMIVLDECDKLLQMGFEEQVRQLLSARFVQHKSSARQMVLLSATLGKSVQTVAREWLGPHSVRIAVGRTGQSSQFVTQHVLVLANEQARTDFCVQMVPTFAQVGRTLIFVATRIACETLAETLERQTGTKAVTLHGDKHQWDRTAALKEFTSGRVPVLVATDVASRGLDIPQVATVLCVHPAKNLDSHTHRVGRAGRLDKNEQQQGSAYTLLTPKDANFARVLKAAWEREGRPVNVELEQLASTSSNTKRSRQDNTVGQLTSSTSDLAPSLTAAEGATGGPAPRAEKKRRWGAPVSNQLG